MADVTLRDYIMMCDHIRRIYLEILAVIKFGDLPEIWQKCIIGGNLIWRFVTLHHCIDIIVCILTNINMAVLFVNAKSPNLNHHQI